MGGVPPHGMCIHMNVGMGRRVHMHSGESHGAWIGVLGWAGICTCILGESHGAWRGVLGCKHMHMHSGGLTLLSGSCHPMADCKGVLPLSLHPAEASRRGWVRPPKASSMNTSLCKALRLHPIFVIYIFHNSVWSGFSNLLHSCALCSLII